MSPPMPETPSPISKKRKRGLVMGKEEDEMLGGVGLVKRGADVDVDADVEMVMRKVEEVVVDEDEGVGASLAERVKRRRTRTQTQARARTKLEAIEEVPVLA